MRFLRKLAIDVLGEDLGRKVWCRAEIIGDIMVIKAPFNISPFQLKPYAEKLLDTLPYVKSVWCAVSEVRGDYRLREYVHLAGEPRSETIYKEHGCTFKVDIRKVYVSQRLNWEHLRIAKLVNPGEIVVNMFAGAGLFSIIIAKHSKPSKVYSIDINPEAYRYMVENVKANKVEDIVEPILGDAATVIMERLRNVGDRVLMPLPSLVHEYVAYAVMCLKGRGYIHLYDFTYTPKHRNPIEVSRDSLEERLKDLGGNFRFTYSRIVRMVGPRRYQVVHDVYFEKC